MFVAQLKPELLRKGSVEVPAKWDTDTVNDVTFNEQGLMAMVISDRTLKVWNTKDQKSNISDWDTGPVMVMYRTVYCVAFSPSSSLMALGGSFGITMVDTNNGEIQSIFETDGLKTIRCVTFDQSGEQLICGSGYDSSVRVFKVSDGSLIRTFMGHTREVTTLALVKNKYIMSGSSDSMVRVWLNKKKSKKPCKCVLKGGRGTVRKITVNRTGSLCAAVSKGGLIVWQIKKNWIRVFERKSVNHQHAEFHPLLKQVVCVVDLCSDGITRIVLWNVQRKEQIFVFAEQDYLSSIFHHLRFMHDGATLMTIDNKRLIQLWNTETIIDERKLSLMCDYWSRQLAMASVPTDVMATILRFI